MSLHSHEPQAEVEIAIIGAGFAGLAMAHRVQNLGMTMQGFESGGDVGGTWYWNRYPGARCDVESMQYSYRFSEELQQEWEWTERYAGQPEILKYIDHVAERFDLRRHFRFRTRVVGAHYDDAAGKWTIETDDGQLTTARFLVAAAGCLSSANRPDIPGLDDFAGTLVHTGHWPSEGLDVSGKRVGVIGTGSSGVQVIPQLARQAAELVVFQRTAAYCVPAHNGPIDQEAAQAIKADYKGFRDRCGKQFGAFAATPATQSALGVDEVERRAGFDAAWARGGLAFQGAFYDLSYDLAANDLAMAYFRDKIHEIVSDPDTAAKLMPKQRFATKRLCIDNDYYATFNRPNVSLVDLQATPLTTVDATGVRTSDGEYPLDVLVLATGYDAMTGSLLRMDIRGRDGLKLGDAWAEGPHTYLGLGVVGFPNLFIISGPGSPSVLSNMVFSIEQQVDWIAECLDYLRENGVDRIEAERDAQSAWVARANAMAAQTLMATGTSWYLGANIPGKPRVFMPYLDYPGYVATCEEVAANGYAGFALNKSTQEAISTEEISA
jgi:cation diffusion facilitator CzcD-associated flavoprotein CzcO